MAYLRFHRDRLDPRTDPSGVCVSGRKTEHATGGEIGRPERPKMSVMGGLVTARVTGSRVRASLVQGNGQRAKVGTGLGKRVARGVAIIVALVVVCREATMHRVFRLRMASPLLMLAFCASVLLVVTTTVRAAPVLDQSHDPTGKVSGIAITSPPVKQELAQTFTVGFTGQLSNVEVKVARSNEFAGPISP